MPVLCCDVKALHDRPGGKHRKSRRSEMFRDTCSKSRSAGQRVQRDHTEMIFPVRMYSFNILFLLLSQGVRSVLNVCKQMLKKKKKAAKIFVTNIVWSFLPLQCQLLQIGVYNCKNNYLNLEGGPNMQYFVYYLFLLPPNLKVLVIHPP